MSSALSHLSDRLASVKRRIELAAQRSGRTADSVKLVAVSKTYSVEYIQQVISCGHLVFGENKVQELVPKMDELGNEIEWHMIGALQSNKIKYMAQRVNWIHSVPKLKTLNEIEKRAADAGRVINVLIQVNISKEDQKSGCEPDELKTLLLESRKYSNLVVRGLMGMASFEDDPELARPQFKLLRELRDEFIHLNDGSLQLEHLSMGMTHDLEAAVEEGATIVRVGSAIFGERD